jgi:hypothetical protein
MRTTTSGRLHDQREVARRGDEAGFALILAILALMLLTFLGLTLATTTSTELQIATNYRWSVQALYNAEAGVEAGKRVLQAMNWDAILPTARGDAWTLDAPGPAPVPMFAGATRDLEMGDCDDRGGGAGYGVVLNDGGGNIYENVTVVPRLDGAPPLNGAFTLWIRRQITPAPPPDEGGYVDDTRSDLMVLTSEGVAPYSGGQLDMAFARANLARRVIEVSLQRQEGPAACEEEAAQLSGRPEGNAVWTIGPCDPSNWRDGFLDNLKAAGLVDQNAAPIP